MYNNKSIRAEAWSLTKANFWKLFGIMFAMTLVPMLIVMPNLVIQFVVENSTSSFGALILAYIAMLLVMPALATGGTRMMLNLHRSGEIRISDLFYYVTSFRRYGKALLLMLAIGIITLVCNLIPFIGQILIIWLTYRLTLATWLFVNDERLTVIECIKFSFELMKGHCWRMFCMMLLLGVICAGIVILCMVPVVIIGVASESMLTIFLMIPLMLVVYALILPFYFLSIAGFAAELMPNVDGQRSTSPEL